MAHAAKIRVTYLTRGNIQKVFRFTFFSLALDMYESLVRDKTVLVELLHSPARQQIHYMTNCKPATILTFTEPHRQSQAEPTNPNDSKNPKK